MEKEYKELCNRYNNLCFRFNYMCELLSEFDWDKNSKADTKQFIFDLLTFASNKDNAKQENMCEDDMIDKDSE